MKKHLVILASVAAVAAMNAFGGISGGASQQKSVIDLMLLGPVEAVLARENAAIVLGQRIQIPAGADIAVGEVLAVYGTLKAGNLVAVQVLKAGPYVPGATEVLLTGVVQKVQASVGRAIVSGVSVDLTALVSLDGSQLIPTVGTVVQVAGIQPASGGVVLVDGISGGAAKGISGGAAKGISGGAAKGISGGAAEGISGGAAKGISGGAALGISGGAAQGISGGAAKGISGGAAEGISGGAAKGISGGAAEGISGGAAKGISGGAAAGISGGAAQGISGGA
jgi:hypothetical protein